MTKTGLIFNREIKAYFNSPVAYVVIALFLITAGITFSLYLESFVGYCERYVKSAIDGTENPNAITPNINEMFFGGVLGNMSMFLLFVLPFVTMRLFAEEKKTGTAELLFTFPLKDLEIIAGKFLACAFILIIMLGMTLIYPAMIDFYGVLSWPVLLMGYLALLLTGLAYISMGLFFSSLTENQIIAASSSVVLFLSMWTLRFFQGAVGESLGKLLSFFSIASHQDSLLIGILDTHDIAYYFSFIFLGLFLTFLSLESRNWRA